MSHDNSDGRNVNGRLQAGNAGGPGNRFAQRTAKLRSALLRAVRPADVESVVAKLVEKAKAGELPAIKELLDRCLGRPKETLEHELVALAARDEERSAMNFDFATEAEVESLRQVRRRIRARMGCERCRAAGGEPCPEHR